MRGTTLPPGSARWDDRRWPKKWAYAFIAVCNLACWTIIVGAAYWLAPMLSQLSAAAGHWVGVPAAIIP